MKNLAPFSLLEVQLILGHQPGAKARRKIFALAGAQIEFHFFHLQHPRAPVVHDHVAENCVISLIQRGVVQGPARDDGYFQFEIQVHKMMVLDFHLAWARHRQMIREVGNGKKIEFRNHVQAAVATGRGNVLAESIAIAHGGGTWHGGEQRDVTDQDLCGGRCLGDNRLGDWQQRVLLADEGEHIHCQARIRRMKIQNSAVR